MRVVSLNEAPVFLEMNIPSAITAEDNRGSKANAHVPHYEEVEGVKIYSDGQAFYNPAQKFNRDISVLVARHLLKDRSSAKILDAMSASGIRGIRYLKEIGSNVHVFFNDSNPKSASEIKKNIGLNGLLADSYTVLNDDCNSLMCSHTSYFDFVDIDPFGSCSLFIDNAIRAVKHNGVLAVTATDTAVLCSNESKCFAKYNTIIKKVPACHEQALRTVLSLISRTASKHGAGIEPLLSISVDFYVRIFVRIIKSKHAAKNSVTDNSLFMQCCCFNTKEIPLNKTTNVCSLCKVCGGTMKLCGPFWRHTMCNREFVQVLVQSCTDTRIAGMLNVIISELDVFGYFSINDMGRFAKCNALSMKKLVCAIANSGYDVSVTHCKLNSLKTNAPLGLLYSAMLKSDKKGSKTLALGDHEVVFDHNDKVMSILNPEFYRGTAFSHMGPMSRKRAYMPESRNCVDT